MDENIRQILTPAVSENIQVEADQLLHRSPVVIVVFDELPLVHLLDQEGNIDAVRFPNFAALAATSTWYSNASTVYDVTIKSVPAILTGLFPRSGRVLPVPKNYPLSLFSMLQNHYEMHVVESLTSLYTDEVEMDAPMDALTVGSDILIFYLRSLLPERAADTWLPLQAGVWGGFLSQEGLRQWLSENADWRRGDRAPSRRFENTKSYIEEMADYPSNTLHYIHIALPHRPYNYVPSGRRYNYLIREDKISVKDMSQPEIDQGRAAHILQVGLADHIIGLLREQLIRLGWWDDALLVVVADHGQDYRARTNNRFITRENLGNVAAVPLMIKYPGQDVAIIDDTNVQTIDIAPTIMDSIELSAPVMDGRSLLDQLAGVPSTKTIMSESGEHIEISMGEFAQSREKSHAEAVAFFGLNDKRSNLFNYGHGLEMIGAHVEEIRYDTLDIDAHIDELDSYTSISLDAEYLPLFVRGTISNPDDINLDQALVAISINNIVWSIARPYRSADGIWRFSKILPEYAFRASNDLVATPFFPKNHTLKQ